MAVSAITLVVGAIPADAAHLDQLYRGIGMRRLPVALAAASMSVIASAYADTRPQAPRPPAVGSQAAPGDLGAAIMSARVSENGTLVQGSGAVSVARLATGNYEITWGRNVQNCAFSVTPDNYLNANFATYAYNGLSYVFAFDVHNQTPFDAGFFILAHCGQ